jgi:hypothetical protein
VVVPVLDSGAPQTSAPPPQASMPEPRLAKAEAAAGFGWAVFGFAVEERLNGEEIAGAGLEGWAAGAGAGEEKSKRSWLMAGAAGFDCEMGGEEKTLLNPPVLGWRAAGGGPWAGGLLGSVLKKPPPAPRDGVTVVVGFGLVKLPARLSNAEGLCAGGAADVDERLSDPNASSMLPNDDVCCGGWFKVWKAPKPPDCDCTCGCGGGFGAVA